jgi:diaminohydroxyphosphoribosylaminopyrimidine deaminase/5-amino-6-(5-phosphoribosylamino)uracil reductase
MRVAARAGRIDLAAAMQALGARGLTRLLVEGGPILSARLIRSDLVDEAVIVRSPRVLGADAIDAIEGMPLSALTSSPRLRVLAQRMAGVDELTHYFRS